MNSTSKENGFLEKSLEQLVPHVEISTPAELHPNHEGGIKSTAKLLKKLARKEHKMMNVVAKQINSEIVSEPTTWVVLWGPSLSMGTSKEAIINLFHPPPEEVRLYENKMYSCLRFASTEDASKAKAKKSGTSFTEIQPMYLGFLKNDPPPESIEMISPFQQDMPAGLELYSDFVSESEEKIIADTLASTDLNDIGQSLKRRWVRHFGYDFNYENNNVDPTSPSKFPIPSCLEFVLERLLDENVVDRKPEQITLNRYSPGQGIPPHVDTHSPFEEPLLSLSLLAPVVMDFRDNDKHFSIVLPRRSLLILKDASRYQWTHGIANRSFDVIPDKNYSGITTLQREVRLSLTFRLLRENKICTCGFPYMCDSQKGKISSENAASLENSLVHKVYEDIASHFSSTRHTAWPKIKEFVQKLNPWDALLDVGCGNGKYLSLRETSFEVGTDMSSGLLGIVRDSKKAEGVKSNCLTLPFKDSSFDAVICIAVLHHLSTKERRLQALNEIIRVLKDGGESLIYVWAKHQEKEDIKSAYAKNQSGKDFSVGSKKCLTPLESYSFLPVHNYETNFTHSDMVVPWISGPDASEVHHRFYHVFLPGELENLINEIRPTPRILDSYYDQGNWCVRVQRSTGN